MKDNADSDGGPLQRRSRAEPGPVNRDGLYGNGNGMNGKPRGEPGAARQPAIDSWTVVDLISQRWHWPVIAALVVAAGFFALGWQFIGPKFTASAKLHRYETPGESDFFKTPLSSETFAALILSPEVLRPLGDSMIPPLPAERLAKFIKVDPQPDADIINVYYASKDPRQAVAFLNDFATNAVSYVRRWYSERAEAVAKDYLAREVSQMDADISALEDKFRNLHVPPELTNKLAQVGSALSALGTNLNSVPVSSAVLAKQRERLDAALGELGELTSKYTDLHPLVQAKRQQINSMESQLASMATNRTVVMAPSPTTSGHTAAEVFNPETDIVRTKLLALQDGRVQLSTRFREAELYAANPPGIVRVLAPASMQTLQSAHRRVKIGLLTIFGGCLGVVAGLGLVLLVEFIDTRLKTAEDLKRVTTLPVLTTLGNLDTMSSEDRSLWAFRAWTMLQGKLSHSPNHGLVCGITSSSAGEGRSTWVHLLAEAASLTGFRVLTIATRPSPTGSQLEEGDVEPDPQQLAMAMDEFDNSHSSALTTSVLSSPAQVTEQLTGPDPRPVVHIPLPGWVWDLERRRQWREALEHWATIDNLVILVELPPASVPEAVLLGSNLPNVLWLASNRQARAHHTREQLQTLRDARCNIVGAGFNREFHRSLRSKFPRWLAAMAIGCSFLTFSGFGQDSTATASDAARESRTNGSFSITRPAQRGAWQQRLTLGPGDVLTFNLFGQPELVRTEVAVAPDGRISFLEAQDVVASGLTVDELRAKVDDELGKFRRAPRSMITPVAFKSKRYYILGKVVTKGVYTLDRPITVLEAIARAHGLENGLVDRNLVDLADFQKSFLLRSGKRLNLDFEQLFQAGDLSQNVAMEPDDYLYVASSDVNEVYVVGEVRLPGAVTYRPDMNIIGAISSRGGYTDRAFKKRVVVVRGSLEKPETIVVDTHAILDAKQTNFKLKPRDIIYVNSRPFILVEEVLDMAATAFIQSLITEWVGVDVVKPIN